MAGSRGRILAAVAAALLVASCSGGAGKSSGKDTGRVDTRKGGTVTETVKVTLTGGPDAGTFEAQARDAGCSYGLTGPDSWGNQYSDNTVTTGLSSLQLIVPSTKAAAAGTDKFLTTVTIGKLLEGRSYEIETRDGELKPGGSGTVTVKDSGNTGTVSITGTTKNNVKIDATITCNNVVRGSSGAAPTTPAAAAKGSVNLTFSGAATGTVNQKLPVQCSKADDTYSVTITADPAVPVGGRMFGNFTFVVPAYAGPNTYDLADPSLNPNGDAFNDWNLSLAATNDDPFQAGGDGFGGSVTVAKDEKSGQIVAKKLVTAGSEMVDVSGTFTCASLES